MGVERGERLVEQQDLGVAREGAGERDALALAARETAGTSVLEVTDPEAVEVLVGLVAARVLDVRAHVEVREQCVVLEDEPDAPLLRPHGDSTLCVEPGLVVTPDRASGRLDEHGALPGARGADEREGRVDRETQAELESPKRDGDLLEGERCHVSAILSVRSRRALIKTSTPPIASVVSKFTSNSA